MAMGPDGILYRRADTGDGGTGLGTKTKGVASSTSVEDLVISRTNDRAGDKSSDAGVTDDDDNERVMVIVKVPLAFAPSKR